MIRYYYRFLELRTMFGALYEELDELQLEQCTGSHALWSIGATDGGGGAGGHPYWSNGGHPYYWRQWWWSGIYGLPFWGGMRR